MSEEYQFYNKSRRLEDNEIFVFGSNLGGRHGKGAALQAFMRYGAKYGRGVGLQGKAYAIPTKTRDLEILPLHDIVPYIHEFVQFTKNNPDMRFYVTPVGCGLAEYKPADIAEHFKGAINCSFEKCFAEFLNSN